MLNSNNFNAQEKALEFSHNHGFFTEKFDLHVTSSKENVTIKYTLNGKDPRSGVAQFSKTLPAVINIDPENTLNRDIAPGVVLRITAIQADTFITPTLTKTFMFVNKATRLSLDNVMPGSEWLNPNNSVQAINYGLDPNVYNHALYSGKLENSLLSIPSLSLVTDLKGLFNLDTGIYVNAFKHGEEWERAASLELLNPDGTEGFQINCGIRIRGGWSRNKDNPKRAFRVFFSSEYGDSKLRYPLFGDEGVDEFDKIDLRTSMNYSWAFYGDNSNTMLRDVFSRDSQRDMNQPYTRSRYYHLYINGTYWGLFQTQERSEASFAENYFGGNREDYDVIKVDVGEFFNLYHVEATDGNLNAWKRLWDIGEAGYTDENYFRVQGLNTDGSLNIAYEKLIDVDNLIDYMICTFYAGDFDGPISSFRGNVSPNNFYAVYNRVNPDGFKFFRHDAEHSLFYNSWGTDRTGPYPAGTYFEDSNPQWLHQRLSVNNNYKLKFADRVQKHFFDGGVFTQQSVQSRIEERKNQIESAIIAESARWGDSKIEPPRTQADWYQAVDFILNDFILSRTEVVLNQLKTKGLYNSFPPPALNLISGIIPKNSILTLSSSGKIYYTKNGGDPKKNGIGGNSTEKYLVFQSTNKNAFVPSADIGNNWTTENYNDDNWTTVSGSVAGVGYENGSGYETFFSLNVGPQMFSSSGEGKTSCYLRIQFIVIQSDLENFDYMHLRIMYDDGFTAYLNGQKIIVVNSPESPQWNSTATENHEAESFELFDISAYIDLLKVGTNVLAIHGLNVSSNSSDFLILPEVKAGSSNFDAQISEHAYLYESPITITETVTIKTRTLYGKDWSPLREAKFLIDENLSNLKVTELHYNPLDGIDTTGKEYEFIELKNTGSQTLMLSGSSFSNGIDFTFSSGDYIQPNEFVVLASDSNYFKERYSFFPNAEYEGQLDNAGERVTLINAVGDTVFSFRYDDKNGWPEAADGDGFSLVAFEINPTLNPAEINYWNVSANINGSPGMDDLISNFRRDEYSKPDEIILHQNYPNPFNPSTVIEFSLPSKRRVELSIFNVLGQKVKRLFDGELPAGSHQFVFNANEFASGLYFYKLQSGSASLTKKLLLIK